MLPYATTTVQDVANAAGCTTTAVEGLSKQIVDEVDCLVPGALTAVPLPPNAAPSAATFAFLQPPASQHLVATLKAQPGMTMNIESMLRTVAQQYLLYAWYQAGQCGIQLAAVPGSSNHEQGLAFDTSDYQAWMSDLQSESFKWFGSSDVVHFDYVGSGAVDLNGKDVLAFQTLWNVNHPNDMIAEDGQYGPETESRLQQSPADGFATPASCGGADGGAPGSKDAGADAASEEAGVDSGAPSQDDAGPSGAGDDASGTGGDDASANGETPAQFGAANGCACRAAPGSRSGGGWVVVAAAALAVAIRRRRG